MNVLVTGGAGYIGSVTCQALLEAGHEVAIVDDLSHGHRNAIPAGARFLEADLRNTPPVRGLFDSFRPDGIVHFAGHIQVGESMRDPLKYLDENVAMGLSLLKLAVEFRVRRVVLSSTANLFDKPARVPIDETCDIIPGSPYGESKAYLERVLSWLALTQNLPSTALRYFNAAGATEQHGEDHDPETHLIPLALQVADGKRGEITVFGDDYDTPDGTCIRDYIHVVDLAAAHILALQDARPGFRTYNVGNGNGFSVKEVLDTVRSLTGHPVPTRIGPRRDGDAARLVADSRRLRAELGWTPSRPQLARIVGDALSWRRRHPSGYSLPGKS